MATKKIRTLYAVQIANQDDGNNFHALSEAVTKSLADGKTVKRHGLYVEHGTHVMLEVTVESAGKRSIPDITVSPAVGLIVYAKGARLHRRGHILHVRADLHDDAVAAVKDNLGI